jgi:tRNA nucleotidyltransferase (CCA-adding enzyme)
MKELGILELYFPELFSTIGIRQDPTHHAEGDVWIHTLRAVDYMASLLREKEQFDDKKKLILLLSALCHDLGKAKTTKIEDDKITSYGHEDESVPLAISFISKLTDDKKLIERIIPLVKYHYAPYNLYKQKAKKSAIRRLSVKLGVASIEELVILAEADYFGRDTSYKRSDKFEAKEWILEIAKNQNIVSNAPKPIVQGRDLIKMGLNPSPKFKEILDKAYELQLAEDNDTLSKEDIIKLLKI